VTNREHLIRKRVSVVVVLVAMLSIGFALLPASADVTSGPLFLGGCGGSLVKGTFNPPLTDQSASTTLTLTPARNPKTGQILDDGACTEVYALNPGNNSFIIPGGGLTGTLKGDLSCADTPAAIAAITPSPGVPYPEPTLSGNVVWHISLTAALNDSGVISVLGLNRNSSHVGSLTASDVFDLGGIMRNGQDRGAVMSGTWWADPVVKAPIGTDPATTPYGTGYVFDSTNAAGCGDSTLANASISTVLIGGGGLSAVQGGVTNTSLIGSHAGGISRYNGEQTSLP
jgi:hypothetical protein